MIVVGAVVKGRKGFGGELGHVLLPYQSIAAIEGLRPACNCGRIGDLESLCSLTAIRRTLLPFFLQRYPGHELAALDPAQAAGRTRAHHAAGRAHVDALQAKLRKSSPRRRASGR